MLAASSAFRTKSVSLIIYFPFFASVWKHSPDPNPPPLCIAMYITMAWPSSKQSGKGKVISIPKKSRFPSYLMLVS